MTAINIVRQRRRLIVLTDTAHYDRNGVVIGFSPKAVAIPHLNAVVASRGASILATILSLKLGLRFESFDAIVEDGGEFIRQVYDEDFATISQAESECEIYVGGWSDSRQRFDVYEIMSEFSPSLDDGMEPWKLHPLDDDALIFAPDPEEDELSRQGFPSGWTVEGFDPVRHGLAVLEAQRRMTGGTTSGSPDGDLHLVGGSAFLIELTREGVSQRVLRQWGDKAGETIRPPAETVVVPMSRQQRRAAERMARA